MENNKIEEFIKIEENVLEVIRAIDTAFPEIFMKYNHYERTAESFYYGGHCVSFAQILIEIFGKEHALVYTSGSNIIDHAITKIGNNFYDIIGNANGEYANPRSEPYIACPDTDYLNYICETMTNAREEHDYEMRPELIEIGKKKVHEIAMSLSEEETHPKSM